MLEKILGRDDTPVSATTQTRIAADPTTQLADATRRYVQPRHPGAAPAGSRQRAAAAR
ncbi:hypothetical protein [Propioniciclava sinopodophylli]|uniref:hypothetical protein n=1 Tax=Propioniciclava sinopodophylli TaxID=1837344 RepID=UPI00248F7429|nr:hypothetical protein [Propioniciclava sinopodophylli]